MASEGTNPPGWYPDPYDPNQLRYWDGVTWTASVTPTGGVGAQPGPPAFGPPGVDHGGPPPAQYVGAPGAAAGGGLGELGPWLNATFSVMFNRIVPVTILLMAVPFLGFVAVAVLIVGAIGDLAYDTTTDELAGVSPALLGIAVLVGLATYALLGLSYLAATHQLYAAHVGSPQTIGRSFTTALRRLPRTIAYSLALLLLTGIAFGVLLALPIVLAVQDTAFLALLIVVVPLLLVLSVFAWVRLSMFMVATVVAPSGTNPISTSWELTADRFWGFLGRLLLLSGLVYVMQSIVSTVLQVIATPLIQNSMGLETDSATGDVLLNGQPIDSVEIVRLSEVFPNFGLLVGFFVLSILIQGASQAVTISGTTALYARAGGPGEV